ncbi:alternative ribosome rescue aminoacyl-tRNA hydrolase ArfB [Candidatus Marimicrobium litorale]|uniref:Aminoacyl-tRNA hydrolase n=1 Tax=Candidatus Marimicrobium litorale TaxID=2518991 RepID=A0ABT3T2Y7_9GAMM|nr:alternative ribosome rescue aminoacyl-tRNA hydrolase ArfB [Candidatus Marimicrobium litorale]MCX2975884.1 aminoacyl-tRNA hydrolase [Candidatus Marimicrobium litorale]
MGLKISNYISIPDEEIRFRAIRAQGAGGQNVNKVSTAIHLRFDVQSSSLPERYKHKLLELSDQRLNTDGEIVIKAQRYRSQEKNRADALARLAELINDTIKVEKRRRPTKPTRGSKQRRMDKKTQRGKLKTQRGRIDY